MGQFTSAAYVKTDIYISVTAAWRGVSGRWVGKDQSNTHLVVIYLLNMSVSNGWLSTDCAVNLFWGRHCQYSILVELLLVGRTTQHKCWNIMGMLLLICPFSCLPQWISHNFYPYMVFEDDLGNMKISRKHFSLHTRNTICPLQYVDKSPKNNFFFVAVLIRNRTKIRRWKIIVSR